MSRFAFSIRPAHRSDMPGLRAIDEDAVHALAAAFYSNDLVKKAPVKGFECWLRRPICG
jgi:hypothetical protein